jgi:hypothetical protein
MRTASIAFILALTGSAVADDLPNHRMTPGATNPALTQKVLCAKGFTTKKYRKVTPAMDIAIFKAYGMSRNKKPCPCEDDHLISLELGGSNVNKNRWPQSYTTKPWNATVKDRLENKLHELVCSGKITLKQAQHEISTNWINSYKTHCKANACPAWRPPK